MDDVWIVLPDIPRKLTMGSAVHASHVTKDWAVVPSVFVPVQNPDDPRGLPVGSMSMGCRIDPSVRSVKSSAIFVPSGRM